MDESESLSHSKWECKYPALWSNHPRARRAEATTRRRRFFSQSHGVRLSDRTLTLVTDTHEAVP